MRNGHSASKTLFETTGDPSDADPLLCAPHHRQTGVPSLRLCDWSAYSGHLGLRNLSGVRPYCEDYRKLSLNYA